MLRESARYIGVAIISSLIRTPEDALYVYREIRVELRDPINRARKENPDLAERLTSLVRHLGQRVLEWDPKDHRRRRVEGASAICGEIHDCICQPTDSLLLGAIEGPLLGLGAALDPGS